MNKPDTSKMDYKYGIFKRISRPYGGPTSMYWTNKQIKSWMDQNDVFYEFPIKWVFCALMHE